jgi:protein-S-isoprenylcysteine O-methyltransferase Ste14
MTHAVAAAVSLVAFMLIVFGGRVLLQVVRTGETGLRFRSAPSSAAFFANLVWALVTVGFLSAPALDHFDVIDPLVQPPPIECGLSLAAIGILLAFISQVTMGESWRIGVKPDEKTALVTRGPYALVRNPIYSAVAIFLFGVLLLVPNAVMIGAFIVALVDVEVQVRVVEEPYLLQTHGDDFRAYARRVGRFVPFIGRLR